MTCVLATVYKETTNNQPRLSSTKVPRENMKELTQVVVQGNHFHQLACLAQYAFLAVECQKALSQLAQTVCPKGDYDKKGLLGTHQTTKSFLFEIHSRLDNLQGNDFSKHQTLGLLNFQTDIQIFISAFQFMLLVKVTKPKSKSKR